jgi:hypothetical protein
MTFFPGSGGTIIWSLETPYLAPDLPTYCQLLFSCFRNYKESVLNNTDVTQKVLFGNAVLEALVSWLSCTFIFRKQFYFGFSGLKIIGHGHPDNNLGSPCIFGRKTCKKEYILEHPNVAWRTALEWILKRKKVSFWRNLSKDGDTRRVLVNTEMPLPGSTKLWESY